MVEIASKANPKIKLVRSLRDRKTRKEQGLFMVEGISHIGLAAENKAPIEFVVYSADLLDTPFAKELVEKIGSVGIETLSTSPEILASLADKDNPAGMLAVVRQQPAQLSDLMMDASAIAAAIVAPQDPGNLGSILRTIDAVGAAGLILLDGGVDPWNPSAVRAGLGAHFTKPIVQASFSDFTRWATNNSCHIYGSSAHTEKDYKQAEYKSPAVLLLGSEREGLSPEQLAICESVVGLPMRGRVTSLNLSVAAGILLYELAAKIS
ncbi:MAG: RNA methyltransferase [Anaerolineales bacterium]